MRKMMMTDHQYQALLGRSGGPSSNYSQLLFPESAPYVSRNVYTERMAAADPYHPTEGRVHSLGGSAVPYPAHGRAENFPDSEDIRAQLAAERRGPSLPSPVLLDYPPSSYADHVGTRMLVGPSISPEKLGAYAGNYLTQTPQRAGQPLSNADLLAARARRSEVAASLSGGYGTEVRRVPPASSYGEPALFRAQAAGILGPGGPRSGRELDQYLLSVQPEKLVRYAPTVLAPDPAVISRSGYPIAGSNIRPEEDERYSNYRRAKARRIESHEFRDFDQDIYRERQHYRERRGGEARGELGRERGRRSPGRRQSNASPSTGTNANRPNNTSQSFAGKRGQLDGGQNKRSRASETSGKPDKAAGPKEKVDNNDSDKDSELGSLCADFSDSDQEKVEKKSDDAAAVIDSPLAGMIFGCSSATFHECMRLQLFGLPAKSKDDVMRVTPGTKVFLFNFDTKELSGIFEAASHGGWQLQPDAFRDFGAFPAQVRVYCSEQCPNIPQSLFKPAIKENYMSQTRFRFDLNTKQVKDLVKLFRQAAREFPRQQDPVVDRYFRARLPFEDYLARGGQQQIPYTRHPQARFGKSRVPYARVVSESANNRVRKSKRASKRALKGKKKRKVSNKPESPMADNCSLYSLSREIQEAEASINASGCDDDSNTNNAVIVREGIEQEGISGNSDQQKEIIKTGTSRNADQQNEIIERPDGKGIAPSSPDHILGPSQPEESPQPQSDLGKEVSFLKDSCNDGNFRLAGSRADKRGQVMGLDVLQGALSSGNEIKSSEYNHSSISEGICPELPGNSTTAHVEPLLNLEGSNVKQLAPTTDSDDQLSELNKKRDREVRKAICDPAHDTSHTNLPSESISTEFGTGRKDSDVRLGEVLMETVKEDGKPSLVGENDGLEVIATEVTIDREGPCSRLEMVVAADGVENGEKLEVIAAKLAMDSQALITVKEMMDHSVDVGKREGLEGNPGESLEDDDFRGVEVEVVTAPEAAGADKKMELISAEIAADSETASETAILTARVTTEAFRKDEEVELAVTAHCSGCPCDQEEAVPAVGTVGAKLELIDSGTSIDREEAELADGAFGNDVEPKVIAAEVAFHSEDPCDREEAVSAVGPLGEELELINSDASFGSEEAETADGSSFNRKPEVIAADVAPCSEGPSDQEEAVPAVGTVGEELELIDSKASFDREEALLADGAFGNDVEPKVIAAEVAFCSEDPCDREEAVPAAGPLGEELELINSEASYGRQEAVTADGSSFNKKPEVIAAGAAPCCEGPSDREEAVPAVGTVGEELELIDSKASFDREEAVTADGAFGNDGELKEIDADSETLCVREEVMIVAQALSSQPVASADIEDKMRIHNGIDQDEEVTETAEEAVDSEQPSPDQNVIHGDEEDEEEVFLTDTALYTEPGTSADEDDDEAVKDQDYEYDEGDDEDEETVDVSVDGELSNAGEDQDEDENNGIGADNDDTSHDD